MAAIQYPKRLIEVDLPIKRISAHARREKSIRNGHISSLHIWWARRPLAACRAVICAALWPDPDSEGCPEAFVAKARAEMLTWTSHERQKLLSEDSRKRFEAARQKPTLFDEPGQLRGALLDFIADFSDWDNSTAKEYLATTRVLTQHAHEALGGAPGTKPLVVDPFAGGGAIPLEALRVGADVFASDLNPVSVLLNKVVLEYVPTYGQRLTDEVRKWGEWIKREAEKELADFYPNDPDGASPIAYLWARTIRCEGPGCGVEVPLINQRLISKRRAVGVELVLHKDEIVINVRSDLPASAFGIGTVTNGKVTCPKCAFTMPADRYRERSRSGQLGERHFCTVLSRPDGSRRYRNPSTDDAVALQKIQSRLLELARVKPNGAALSPIPDELLSTTEPRRLNVRNYGFYTWGSLFSPRQNVAWATLSTLLHQAFQKIEEVESDTGLARAVSTALGLVLSNLLQYNCNMSTWLSDGMISVFIQSSSIPMRADYAEANPLMERLVGGLSYQLERTCEVLGSFGTTFDSVGTTAHASATDQLLADDSVAALITDPPYYFAIPYAELSDFFYVWLKRFLGPVHPDILRDEVTPKKKEAIQNLPHSQAVGQKDRQHFEDRIFEALEAGRREVGPSGIAVIVFAHASTEGWESLLNALLRAGWIITGSWPIDTEKEGRMLASRQKSLASSVHLVCRPRENPDGSLRMDEVGDWRDVLRELPRRVHEWMPRLAEEGVVGADAIFACLGPALEVFSHYSRVEKASGEAVTLKEYLEEVWATVAKEALALVFKDADTTGFEPDARLTAMWLWTLNAGAGQSVANDMTDEEDDDGDDAEGSGSKAKAGGFTLEYDAARKISQGLGANLEALVSVVEISGDRARLLPVTERARFLFGKVDGAAPAKSRGRKPKQADFFAELKAAEHPGEYLVGGAVPKRGDTTLDRVHQTMILFGTGRSEALKRFLIEDGIGREPSFWRLAQALSALYPATTDEKRWVDGVLARKKGLGL